MKNRIKEIVVSLVLALGLSGSLAAGGMKEYMHIDAALDRPVVPANQEEQVVVQIKVLPEFVGSVRERPPVNLSLVLDRSGSMSGQKIEQAIQAAEVAVGRLGGRDRISVIIYDGEVETLAPSQLASRQNIASIRRQLRGVLPRGNTAIYAGLNQAAAELRRYADAGYINRMILLSDGLANSGPSQVADFRALGRAFAGEDIVISTVGLGLGFNEDIMTTLADAAQGNTYFVENADELPRIFAGELGDALNVAATNVEIIVRPVGRARILRSIGREADMSDGVARFKMPQVYNGLEKLALLELEIPEGRPGAVNDLIDVEVRYVSTSDDVERTQHVSVPVTYTDVVEDVTLAARQDVAQNVVDNRIAEAKEEAIFLADKGDLDGASLSLRAVANEVGASYGFFDDGFAAGWKADLEAEAADVQSNGLSGAKRKAYRSETFQLMNQQSVQ